MWIAVAEEDIPCTECWHTISSGTVCISQMPPRMPDQFRRSKYENFCVDCRACNMPMRPCYARRLNHSSRKIKAKSNTCLHCRRAIPDGTSIAFQTYYDWPDSEKKSESMHVLMRHGGAAAGLTVGTATNPAPAVWQNLSRSTQRRFQYGGLGRGLGSRSPTMAKRLFEKEVPRAIRRMGEPATKDFVKGKHFSHIAPVAKVPGKAKAPSNVILEDATTNLARGSRQMSAVEREAARSVGRTSAIKTGARSAIKGGAKAGLVAAATEAAVAIPENYFHYKRGRKSGQQATKDVAKSTVTAAGFGIATAGVTKGAAMAGIGLSLGPLGTPLMIGGGALLAGSAIYRIAKAAKRDLPLDEYRVFFCDNSQCRIKFAGGFTKAALETT